MGGWVVKVADSKKLDQLWRLDKSFHRFLPFFMSALRISFVYVPNRKNYIFLSCIFKKTTCKSFENIKDYKFDLTQENKAYFICDSKIPIFLDNVKCKVIHSLYFITNIC